MQAVLSASTPSHSPVSSPPTVMPPPAPSAPVVVASTTGLHCTYCQCDGHMYQDCYKRRRDQGRRGGRPPKGSGGSSHSGASASCQGSSGDVTQQLFSLLQHLGVGSFSDSSGSARMAFAFQQSSSPSPPLLSDFSFFLPLFRLQMVPLFLLLAEDRRTGTLLGTGPQCRDLQRLWELDWLHLPSAVFTSQSGTTTTSSLAASSTAPSLSRTIVSVIFMDRVYHHYCCAWSPERHPALREYSIKVPKTHSVLETNYPGSRCYSCSAGHSPASSPVALRCRSTRLTNLLNKNEVLDRYIDGEQEAAILNQKQNSPTRSAVSNLGRPPRPQSTVPSLPKSTKEILETYPNVDIKDAYLRQLAQEGTRDTYKIATPCNASRNHASVSDAFERFPHLEDYKSESVPSVEDIYEDLQDIQPPNVICPSIGPIPGITSRCSIADSCFRDAPKYFHDNDMDFAPGEQETYDKLLQRAKEVEARFIFPCGDNCGLNMPRDKRLSSNDMFQLIQCLTEDRRQLAHELSSQIKARLTERLAAKEQCKQSKKELDIRIRRLEKEKTEVQTILEREMDRRSNDWSVRLLRLQSEEERLRERVRELAEQNVSFQREVTFLEANKVDSSDKVASLEMQNRKLNDELEKVINENDSLHNSSIELNARFTKAAEEKDHMRGFLKDKEGENKALHKVIARLQTMCNEQERTITSLRQGYSAELDKKTVECSSEEKNRMQMELIRLTGVEQKLRTEVQSCHIEVESLRNENIALLNRLQSTENGSSFSSIRLDQELQVRMDNLQIHGLSLLDKTIQLCTKSLDLIKCKRHKNGSGSDIDALTVTDYTMQFQSIKGGIESLKRSLRTISSVLTEKQNMKEKSGETAVGGRLSREQKDDLSLDNSEPKLKEEAILNRVLKEALLSKELDIEQLQSDLSSSLRIQDAMKNEIQRVQDELSCITHKAKHLELQGLKKDGSINQIQQDFQESAKELTALRGALKTVTDERDLLWQEAKQLRKTISIMQNEIASLKKKIESLEEDILVKEGQISILHDNSNKPQLDFISVPRSLKQFDME